MHRLLVLYPPPVDPAAFAAHYRDVHLPLAAQLPGATAMSYALGLDGGPYHAVFQAEFPDGPALEAALGSPEGQAVQADVPNYATGGAIVLAFPAEPVALG